MPLPLDWLSMPESLEEQARRLELMAEDDGSEWDLSDNDRAAIRAVVADYKAMKGAVGILKPEGCK